MNQYTELRCYAIFVPKLFIDGSKWCALYGDNIQEGIAGFGDSPNDALADYEHNFYAEIKQ